ncbi:MAG: MFS transporter [Hyphomicrobiaceae bacterium]
MSDANSSIKQAWAGWVEIFSGRYGIYTFTLSLGVLLFAINQFVVATVMPSVVADLGGLRYYTWAFSLFAVGAIIGAASAGPMRDAIGVRLAYVGAGLVLGIGLAGSAMATDMLTLVAWRMVQGIGGGAVASQAYGLIATIFPDRLRSRVLSVVSTIWGIATVGGPGFGAFFADTGQWPWAFWSLVPLAGVFALLAWRNVEGEQGHGDFSKLPYLRLALLALAVLLLSSTSLASVHLLQGVLVIAAVAAAGGAFAIDARAERNVFPRQVTAIATELGATYWIFFLVSVVMAVISTYTTFYLQVLHGVSPLVAGYLFAIQSLMWTIGALLVAALSLSYAIAAILIGLFLLLVSSLILVLTVDHGPVWVIAVAIAVSGTGIGLLNNPAIQVIMAVAQQAERQIAGTSVQAVRNIGISFGAAASGTIAALAGLADGASHDVVAVAMEWVFFANVVVSVTALVIAGFLMVRRNA